MAHDHHHHHKHDEDEKVLQEQLDTAGQSLTRALQISFVILKGIIVILLIIFVGSGIFQIQQDEEALLLRFGKIQGPVEDPVLKPGIKFGFPEPIDEIIRIPVKREQALQIDTFWYFETEQEKLSKVKMPKTGPLDPIMDGYNLTRNEILEGMEGTDYNIVHSMWTITYKIESPKLFFENVYIRDREPGEDLIETAAETLDPILKSLASNAITLTMVEYTIDEAIKNAAGIAANVRVALQDKLDQIRSGIQVKDVRANRIVWPRQVDIEFQDSIRAGQVSSQSRIDAEAYRVKMMTDTGGPRAEAILDQLVQKDLTQAEQEALVAGLTGQVQTQISEARAYRTQVVEEAKAQAQYLKNLLPEYRKNPKLVLQKIYQDAIEEVLANVDEKIFIEPTPENVEREIRILLNRDPNLKKAKSKENSQQR